MPPDDFSEYLDDLTDEERAKIEAKVTKLDQTKKRKAKPPPTPPPPGGWPAWFGELRRDDRGRVYPDLHNVMIALGTRRCSLTHSASTRCSGSEMLDAPLPLAPNAGHAGGPYPRQVRDEDVSQLQEWLQRYIPRVGVAVVHQAVHQRARERAYHPTRDWLDSLKGDGQNRIDTWLTVYLGADPTAHGSPDLDRDAGGNPVIDDSEPTVMSNGVEYLKAIGRMWLVAMVARIYRPGCKQDHMPVLEGDQGILKSAACQVLAGTDHFSDHLPDIGRKDADQHLRGKWLVELAELWAMSRAQVDHFKSFLTRDTERYRPAYGRNDVQEPRTCVFVGTTNRDQYLQDETGNRRVWPIKCTTIDIEGLRRDRDLLFAEAVKLYRDGVQWWPDRAFEKKHIAPQQEARREPDILVKPIAEYLDTLPEPDLLTLAPRTTTLNRLALDVLGYDDPAATKRGDGKGLPLARFGTREQRRISGILTGLGYKPRHTRYGNVWELYAKDRT